MSSRPIPPTFNPHGNHYFTSSVASPPSAHHPYYRGENAYIPLPSPHTTSPTSILNLNGQMAASAASSSSYAPSLSSSSTQYQPAVHAPQPRPSSKPMHSSASLPIFTPFRPDKSSPDLSDVLSKKKSASAWPAQPVFVQSSPKPQKPCDNWETYAVFLSNHTKTVALWNQKVSRDPDYPVVWDYHCILLLKSKVNTPSHGDDESSWIFDYDSRLAMPCPLKEYIAATLGTCLFQSQLDDQFQSLFRVVPAVEYLDSFASDRSHMMTVQNDGTRTYIHPPPSYPCVAGKRVQEQNITHNLMDAFVSMSSSSLECIGKVMTFSEFCSWTSIAE